MKCYPTWQAKAPAPPISQLLAVLCLLLPLAAQQRYLPTDVELGSRLYRNNCFACHGPEGASIPGVDFRRGQFKRVSSDEDLFRVIVLGVPGTAMPPTNISDSNRLALVAYVRSLHDSASSAMGSGDVTRGRVVFEGKGGCQMCHRVNGQGARTGPDLSEVGAIRAAAYLERARGPAGLSSDSSEEHHGQNERRQFG